MLEELLEEKEQITDPVTVIVGFLVRIFGVVCWGFCLAHNIILHSRKDAINFPFFFSPDDIWSSSEAGYFQAVLKMDLQRCHLLA